jgi:NAD(P)-dependent dehydrogenase (short-subunit alcohol dehydrogenase family)
LTAVGDTFTGHGLGLAGRRAIVTGASSGLGAEIARDLGRAGAAVVLVGRDADRLGAVASEVRAHDARALALLVDITAPGGPDEIVDRAVAEFGRIDVIVHSAGLFRAATLADTTDEILDEQWDANVRAPFRLTRAAAPHMEAGGSVIFVTSIAGHVGFADCSAYCATKGAVELLVKSLALELAPRGVRVNAVAPGNIRTPINADALADPEYEREVVARTPAGRVGEVQDIGPAVLFLASSAAGYMHGASIVVDGGWVAG